MEKTPMYFVSSCLFLACLASFAGVASTLKCYSCESSNPTCLENFFVSAAITVVEGCTCCQKQVSSSGTKRDCGLVNCAPLGGNHVCFSDYCNSANVHTTGRRGVLLAVAILASVAAGTVILRLF